MSTNFTTPAKFLCVTETPKGVKIHRVTCKRRGDSHLLSNTPLEIIAQATPATCCRPKAAEEYINNANDLSPLPVDEDSPAYTAEGAIQQLENSEAVVEVSPEVEEKIREGFINDFSIGEQGPEPIPEPEPKPVVVKPTVPAEPPTISEAGGGYSLEVFFSEAGVARAYWQTFGVEGGTAIAERWTGMHVQPDKVHESITLISPRRNDVVKARKAVVDMWTDGWAAFRVWRKTDPDYKALPPSDTHWMKSERFAAERQHLLAYAHGIAEMI